MRHIEEVAQNMKGKAPEPAARAERTPHANGRGSRGDKTSRSRSNGHAAANGAAVASVERGEAASDAAGELSVANAAGTSAAGADRQGDADAASAPSEPKPGARPKKPKQHGEESSDASKKRAKKIPPGTTPLPIDGEAFVDAVHSHVDLIKTEVKLLHSEDEKVVQRELAYLRELRYGKRASSDGDQPTQIIYDAPRPERDMP